MESISATEAYYQSFNEIAVAREQRRRREAEVDQVLEPSRSFRIRLGGSPINLSLIEFRLIYFLSKSPYKAFTRKQIVNGIDREDGRITEESVDTHVRSLRDKLGIFNDFIQSVPYIGYRFKP